MKKIILTINFLFFIFYFAFSQTPNWDWAKRALGVGYQKGYNSATDNSGNVYVTGSFYGLTIWFDTIALTNSGGGGCTPVGCSDMFLVKYNPSGNALWARSNEGISSNDEGYVTVTDANGNVYVTGIFGGDSITFGSITLINTNSISGKKDIFLVKYDSNGNFLWVKSAGGNDDDISLSATTDPDGNVYITGSFKSTSITFDSIILNNYGFGTGDFFLAKYDSNGNVLWAKEAGGSLNDVTHGVATDSSRNVYIIGNFGSPVLILDSITLVNAGNWDVFIAKYDSSGNVLWAKRAGTSGTDEALSVATDLYGNVYGTGFFGSSIVFDTITLLSSGGNIFLVKYNSNGNAVWAKDMGGSSTYGEIPYAVATDPVTGDVYISGTFTSPSIVFDTLTLVPPVANCPGFISCDPMFIVKYSSSGTFLFALVLSSGGYNKNNIRIDHFGNVYIAGDYSADPFIIGTDTLDRYGNENIFVAKLSLTVGVATNQQYKKRISFFPNPFDIDVSITIPEQNIKLATIIIHNILGQTVFSKQEYNFSSIYTKTFDLGFLSKGIYLLDVNIDGERTVKKIVKE